MSTSTRIGILASWREAWVCIPLQTALKYRATLLESCTRTASCLLERLGTVHWKVSQVGGEPDVLEGRRSSTRTDCTHSFTTRYSEWEPGPASELVISDSHSLTSAREVGTHTRVWIQLSWDHRHIVRCDSLAH